MFKVGKLLYGYFHAFDRGDGKPLYPVSQDGEVVAYFVNEEDADTFARESNRAPVNEAVADAIFARTGS